MRRARKPFCDDALELVGDHPGVRCHDQLEQPFHTSCRQRLLVVFEHGLKRLGGAPLRMFRGERLDTVQGERELDVEWLLIPERPIVVEDGNPRRGCHVNHTILLVTDRTNARMLRFTSPSFHDEADQLGPPLQHPRQPPSTVVSKLGTRSTWRVLVRTSRAKSRRLHRSDTASGLGGSLSNVSNMLRPTKKSFHSSRLTAVLICSR